MKTINYKRFIAYKKKFFNIKALLHLRRCRSCRRKDRISEDILIQMDKKRWENLLHKKILRISTPTYWELKI